mgnify:CR=1 FL=1
MKKTLSYLLFISLTICSCSDKSAELNTTITKLKKENDSLRNILKQSEIEKIKSSQLYLIPHSLSFKANKPNTITAVISEIQKYPDFEAYYVENDNYTEKDKIAIKRTGENEFEFNYIPKKKTVNQEVKIALVYKTKGTKIALFGITDLPVE